jgi:hypothetical protein
MKAYKYYLLRVEEELWEKILREKARIEAEKQVEISINKFLHLLIELGLRRLGEER